MDDIHIPDDKYIYFQHKILPYVMVNHTLVHIESLSMSIKPVPVFSLEL